MRQQRRHQAHGDHAPAGAHQRRAERQQQTSSGEQIAHEVGGADAMPGGASDSREDNGLHDDQSDDQVDDVPMGEQLGHGLLKGLLSSTTASVSTAAKLTQARYGTRSQLAVRP